MRGMDGAHISAEDDRVADAPSGNWVYHLLPRSLWPFAQLARWDRPIGWWLLLWPCWWSLALAAGQDAVVDWTTLLLAMGLFWLGAVAMRGAGCTYNDMVDVAIDAQVARTASRPIPSGRVSKVGAVLFTGVQLLTGFGVLVGLCLLNWTATGFNTFAFVLALASLAIVAAYPFAKRVTDWPQVVLGLAFSWGALLGWAVLTGTVAAPAVWLYAGAIMWTVGYDTIYAHQDREDDALIGVRSTARLFGERTKAAIIALYCATVVLLAVALATSAAGWLAYAGLAAAFVHMVGQLVRLDIDDGDTCLAIFKSNRNLGWIVFAGLVADVMV